MNVRARTTAKGRVLWLQIRSTLAQKQSNMSTFTRKSLKSNFCILLPHFAHFCIGSLNTPPKNNAQKDRENARKRPKMTPKMGQNGPKRPQNEVKTKWRQNCAKFTPKWPKTSTTGHPTQQRRNPTSSAMRYWQRPEKKMAQRILYRCTRDFPPFGLMLVLPSCCLRLSFLHSPHGIARRVSQQRDKESRNRNKNIVPFRKHDKQATLYLQVVEWSEIVKVLTCRLLQGGGNVSRPSFFFFFTHNPICFKERHGLSRIIWYATLISYISMGSL